MNTAKILLLLLFSTVLLNCGKEDEEEGIEIIEEVIEEDTLEEKYSGTWSSTLPSKTYDEIPISAKITPVEGTDNWTGEFFFTSNYKPCCGDVGNNGTLELTIEGDQITVFEYDDTLTNCEGTFTGTGEVDGSTLKISFTGFDCEGNHSDGLMTLNKKS